MDRIDLWQHRAAAATNVREPKRRERSLSDNQALKQWFLVRAEALSEQPEVFRCQAVTQLISEMVAFEVRAEAEVFQAAYGDSSGQKYWDAHLSEAIRDPANVLGTKDLLGHESFAPTEKYYIMTQSRLAGHALARAVDNLRKGPAVS